MNNVIKYYKTKFSNGGRARKHQYIMTIVYIFNLRLNERKLCSYWWIANSILFLL